MTSTEYMIADIVVLFPILAVLIYLLSLSIRWVPRNHARNVIRWRKWWFGAPWLWPADRFHRTIGPGLHMIIPGVDRAGPPIDVRPQVVSLSQREITADSQAVTVETVVSFQVTNPRAAADECGDQRLAVERHVSSLLLSLIASTDLEQALASRDKFSTELRERLERVSDKWGIRVSSAEVRSIADEPKVIPAPVKRDGHPQKEEC